MPVLTAGQSLAVERATRVHAADGDFVVRDHTSTDLPEGWVLLVVGAVKRRPRLVEIAPDGSVHRRSIPMEGPF